VRFTLSLNANTYLFMYFYVLYKSSSSGFSKFFFFLRIVNYGWVGIQRPWKFNQGYVSNKIRFVGDCCIIQTHLVAMIFKEKYYLHGTILESKLGSRSSYAWRSIWNTSDPLKPQDRASIKIWQDKWLPTPTSYMVQSPRRILIMIRFINSTSLIRSKTGHLKNIETGP